MPAGFRFAVKLPKTITHGARLVGTEPLLDRFAEEVAGLGGKLGPVLVQLPPSLAFDAEVADRFFVAAASLLGAHLTCEPRHATWFEPAADALLAARHVSRVAADPARVPEAARPGGWTGLTYARWHGSPRVYWSFYDDAAIGGHAALAGAAAGESWTIYDNTAAGGAAANALSLAAMVAA